MSITYEAYAIIGCKIPSEKLFQEKSIPHNKHAWPNDAKFCPECGAKTCQIKTVPIPEFDGDINLSGLSIVWDSMAENAFVGIYIVGDKEKNEFFSIAPSAIEGVKNNLKQKLTKIGLWNPKEFGLWSVLKVW